MQIKRHGTELHEMLVKDSESQCFSLLMPLRKCIGQKIYILSEVSFSRTPSLRALLGNFPSSPPWLASALCFQEIWSHQNGKISKLLRRKLNQ